jgi:hypothetical protein
MSRIRLRRVRSRRATRPCPRLRGPPAHQLCLIDLVRSFCPICTARERDRGLRVSRSLTPFEPLAGPGPGCHGWRSTSVWWGGGRVHARRHRKGPSFNTSTSGRNYGRASHLRRGVGTSPSQPDRCLRHGRRRGHLNIAVFLDWATPEGEEAGFSGYESDSLLPFAAFLGIGFAVALLYAASRAYRRQHRGLSLASMAVGLAVTLQSLAWILDVPGAAERQSELSADIGSWVGLVGAVVWTVGSGMLANEPEGDPERDRVHDRDGGAYGCPSSRSARYRSSEVRISAGGHRESPRPGPPDLSRGGGEGKRATTPKHSV